MQTISRSGGHYIHLNGRDPVEQLTPWPGHHLVLVGEATDVPMLQWDQERGRAKGMCFSIRVPRSGGSDQTVEYLIEETYWEPEEKRAAWLSYIKPGAIVEVTVSQLDLPHILDEEGRLRPQEILLPLAVRVFVPHGEEQP